MVWTTGVSLEAHGCAVINRGAICGDNVTQHEAQWKRTSSATVSDNHVLKAKQDELDFFPFFIYLFKHPC